MAEHIEIWGVRDPNVSAQLALAVRLDLFRREANLDVKCTFLESGTIMADELFQALGELTRDQQDVIALRFGYEMPIKDVAQTMGKSEGAVKQLQARAIAALSRKLSVGRVS